jgi:hypothetical protein
MHISMVVMLPIDESIITLRLYSHAQHLEWHAWISYTTSRDVFTISDSSREYKRDIWRLGNLSAYGY